MFFTKNTSKFSPPFVEQVQDSILDYLLKSKTIQSNVSTALNADTHLSDDLGLDSIDIVELIVHLEKVYQINFEQAEKIPTLNTIGKLAKFVVQLTNSKSN